MQSNIHYLTLDSSYALIAGPDGVTKLCIQAKTEGAGSPTVVQLLRATPDGTACAQPYTNMGWLRHPAGGPNNNKDCLMVNINNVFLSIKLGEWGTSPPTTAAPSTAAPSANATAAPTSGNVTAAPTAGTCACSSRGVCRDPADVSKGCICDFPYDGQACGESAQPLFSANTTNATFIIAPPSAPAGGPSGKVVIADMPAGATISADVYAWNQTLLSAVAADGGCSIVGQIFDIHETVDGKIVHDTVNASVTLPYDPAKVKDSSALRVCYLNEQTHAWEPQASTVDAAVAAATATVAHFSIYAVGSASAPTPAPASPPTPAPAPAESGGHAGIIVVAVLVVAAVCAGGFFVYKRMQAKTGPGSGSQHPAAGTLCFARLSCCVTSLIQCNTITLRGSALRPDAVRRIARSSS